MVALLAAAVVACTSAALTLPATTMTNDGVENTLGTGTTAALAVDPNAASSETAVDSSTPESVAPAVEESAPQSAPETAEESEPASEPTESETVSEPAAQTEETAALPQGAEVPANYTQPYTFRDEENGFTVTVWAPEGAFDEEVTLKAKLLDETDSAYAEAKQELDEKAAEEPALLSEDGETPDYGFAALDIHFENAAGEEIEPQGDVYVAIDADKLLPEDADPDSVMVQHHAEQDNGDVTVETVADTADETDGKIETTAASDDTANVQAAFEVNQFSTFTVTWGYRNTITFELVDENGQSIGADVSDERLDLGDTFDISDDVPQVEGYTFDHAEYGFYGYKGSWNKQGNVENSIAYYSGKYGSTYVEVDGDRESYVTTVRLYYKEKENPGGGGQGGNPGGDQGGTVTDKASVTTGKTAELRKDGNYDLTLSVTGDRGTIKNQQNVDVMFIVDVSGSMEFGMNQHYYNWVSGEYTEVAAPNNQQRIDAVSTAVNQITNGLSGNQNLNVQYSLVTFSGNNDVGYKNIGLWDGYYYVADESNNDANLTTGWTSDKSTIQNAVKSINPDGGTNYQAGLMVGKQRLSSARNDALKVVIFLSDGDPTFYYAPRDGYYSTRGYNDVYADEGDTVGSGSDYDQAAMDYAVSECNSLNANYFYCIGVGPEATADGSITRHLQQLEDAATNVPSTNKDTIPANNTNALLQAFEDIQSQITFFAATDVTMTDPLSEYAEIVPGENNQVMFTVKLEKQNEQGGYDQVGEVQTVASGSPATFTTQTTGDDGTTKDTKFTITPSFNDESNTITAVLAGQNNKSYELAPGYRYSISTVITPSQAAKNAGMDSDAAKQTPDDGTGTHADNGEQGFWSNDNDKAKVTYTANGEEGSKNFPKPVIQVTDTTPSTASVSFHKVNGDGNTPLAGAEFNLYYEEAETKYYYVQITELDGTEKFDWYTEDQIASSSSGTSTVKKYAYTSGNDGLFTIAELPTDKDYYLVEVKAPDGYQLLEDAIHLVYQGENESKKWVAYSNTASTESGSVANALKTDDNGAYYIHNSTGTVLPSTGSIGTTPFATIGGPLFAVCTVGLGFGLRRRRGKEAK